MTVPNFSDLSASQQIVITVLMVMTQASPADKHPLDRRHHVAEMLHTWGIQEVNDKAAIVALDVAEMVRARAFERDPRLNSARVRAGIALLDAIRAERDPRFDAAEFDVAASEANDIVAFVEGYLIPFEGQEG